MLKDSRKEVKAVNDKLLQSLNYHMGPTLLSYTGSLTSLVKERIATLEKIHST